MAKRDYSELTARYADMLSAMGTEPRLRIVRLLLSPHPGGCLSNRRPTVVRVRREGTYLWYSANTEAVGGEFQNRPEFWEFLRV